MNGNTLRIVIAIAVSALAVDSASAQVVSTFDSTDQGWRVVGDNTSGWRVDQGNPGGCFDINDFATGQHNYAVAPPAFLGNWSAFTINDYVAADIFFRNTSGGSRSDQTFVFSIEGPGGAARTLFVANNYPVQNTWFTWQAAIDPSVWTLQRGTWSRLLASVTSLRISVEYVNGDEIVRMDNPRLSRSPTGVFLPDVVSRFDADLEDWSFQAASGLAFVGNWGNSGGCVRVVAGAGAATTALMPSRFLGDWRSLNGLGRVGFDLRVESRSGSVPAQVPVLRMSGPGGAAVFWIAAADLPLGPRTWRRFRAPIQAASWQMVSGSWTALLADVRSCNFELGFASGGMTVALDNVQRALDTAPFPDDVVVAPTPGVAVVGWAGFVGPSSIARDPSTGSLGVLVDDSIANGGGLWRLTGDRLMAVDRPAALLFGSDGSAFVSEDWAGVIRRRDPAGAVAGWVSGFHSGDDDPFGMAVAPIGFGGANVGPGDVLVVDRGNGGPDEVWSFSRHAAEGERLLFNGTGLDLRDIASFSDGRVYALDTGNGSRLLRMLPDGSTLAVALATPLTTPQALAADDATGLLYAIDGATQSVHRIDPASGQSVLVASGFLGVATGHTAIELDERGRRLWVADTVGNRVWEFALTAPRSLPIVEARGVECGSRPFAVTAIGDSSAWVGQAFGLELAQVAGPGPAWLAIGLSDSTWGAFSLPLELSAFGMQGCFALASPDATTLVAIHGAAGVTSLGIPNTTGLAGLDLFLQAVAVEAGANALGLVTSRALHIRIGRR